MFRSVDRCVMFSLVDKGFRGLGRFAAAWWRCVESKTCSKEIWRRCRRPTCWSRPPSGVPSGARADVRVLEVALVYADRFHPSACPARPGRRSCDGRERAVVLGGEGCPEILEFAVAEFGVVLGVSPRVAANYLGQALALRHRFPHTWARVQAGEATAWKACRIVADCVKLSEDAARYVDQRVAPLIDSITPYRLNKIVQAAKMHADPDAARAEAEEKARERGVFVARSDTTRHQDDVHQGRRRCGDPQRGDPGRDRRGAEDLRRHPPRPAPPRRRGRDHRRPPLHPRTPHPSPPPPHQHPHRHPRRHRPGPHRSGHRRSEHSRSGTPPSRTPPLRTPPPRTPPAALGTPPLRTAPRRTRHPGRHGPGRHRSGHASTPGGTAPGATAPGTTGPDAATADRGCRDGDDHARTPATTAPPRPRHHPDRTDHPGHSGRGIDPARGRGRREQQRCRPRHPIQYPAG